MVAEVGISTTAGKAVDDAEGELGGRFANVGHFVMIVHIRNVWYSDFEKVWLECLSLVGTSSVLHRILHAEVDVGLEILERLGASILDPDYAFALVDLRNSVFELVVASW